MDVFHQVVNLLAGEAFHFRGARIRNCTGKSVRLEIETDAYEVRKVRNKDAPVSEQDTNKHCRVCR